MKLKQILICAVVLSFTQLTRAESIVSNSNLSCKEAFQELKLAVIKNQNYADAYLATLGTLISVYQIWGEKLALVKNLDEVTRIGDFLKSSGQQLSPMLSPTSEMLTVVNAQTTTLMDRLSSCIQEK